MAEMRQYIAVDLGAESGRVILGSVWADRLALDEIHRFSNNPVEDKNSLRWDFNQILTEVKTGIAKAVKQADGQISGIGVDSWGVDYGLLDADGKLIENPYHYRDSRTDEMMEKAFELMGKRQIYEHTGLQFLQFNTIYQLLATRLNSPGILARADKLILMADLVAQTLCGREFAEYTLASTSQLMNMTTGQWSKEIFEKLSLPVAIMPEIVKPGTVVGQLTNEICREIGCEPIPIIAVGSHDTASAVAAVPAGEGRWAYISSGTWSLIGVEVPQAVINDKTFEYSFTNEGGVRNTIRLLKNVMGLWLVQQCRKKWADEGAKFSYSELTETAESTPAFTACIDPDYNEFLSPGDMPEKINTYLAATGQQGIDDKAQIVRVILESLALKYRWVIERLEDITDETIDCLHIVGGGIQNDLLCRFAADAVSKTIYAGPIEATATGNILMQAIATGQIESLARGRAIVRGSFELKEYQPKKNSLWEEKYLKFKAITGLS